MKTHSTSLPLTLADAFEQFLEASSFARRTRESYTEDLAPLLTQVGQKPITALSDADLTADGYARLSYRQADTLWKCYTPDWDLHQLRHTAISLRAAHGYTEVDLKRFSGHTSLRSSDSIMTCTRIRIIYSFPTLFDAL